MFLWHTDDTDFADYHRFLFHCQLSIMILRIKIPCWLGIIPQAVSALATLRLSSFIFQLSIQMRNSSICSST